MYTNLNPRTMGLNHHGFEELLGAAHRAGFRGIEVPAGAFGTPEAAREARARMESMGMRFGLIMTPCDMYRVPDGEFARALEQWARWAELAAMAGCSRAYNHIWSGSDERPYEENVDWHVHRMQAIYKICRDNGLRYGLEFMGPVTVQRQFKHPFIRSLSGVLSLAESVDREIGLVFDTIHWYCSGSNPDDLYYAAMHPHRVVNLHLNDATATREAQIDSRRGMPMEHGIIDAVSVLRLFEAYGYDGPVIIEPMQPTTGRYENMDLDDAAREAIAALHAVFQAAGVVER